MYTKDLIIFLTLVISKLFFTNVPTSVSQQPMLAQMEMTYQISDQWKKVTPPRSDLMFFVPKNIQEGYVVPASIVIATKKIPQQEAIETSLQRLLQGFSLDIPMTSNAPLKEAKAGKLPALHQDFTIRYAKQHLRYYTVVFKHEQQLYLICLITREEDFSKYFPDFEAFINTLNFPTKIVQNE